jgi:hypothetical protein
MAWFRTGHPVELNDRVLVASFDDPMAGILAPFWQLVLGTFVVVFVIGAGVRILRRPRSRMTTALMVSGLAVVGLVVLTALTSR